jgi:hypothetical protein
MKKLLGLIAIVAVVFTLTMTINTSNEKTEGLSDMIAYNIAEAAIDDIDPVWGCVYTGSFLDQCNVPGMSVIRCRSGIPTSCGVKRPTLETIE